MRMGAAPFRAELSRNLTLQRTMHRYAYVAMATAMQIAACNNIHLVDARLARWLLMTSDQLSSNDFFLTQEFLAQMLGVRRTGVSEAGTRLQKRGLVSYRRGKVTIVDRTALTAAACGCYQTIRSLG
jgi:CRP-like cAMP-binding protein